MGAAQGHTDVPDPSYNSPYELGQTSRATCTEYSTCSSVIPLSLLLVFFLFWFSFALLLPAFWVIVEFLVCNLIIFVHSFIFHRGYRSFLSASLFDILFCLRYLAPGYPPTQSPRLAPNQNIIIKPKTRKRGETTMVHSKNILSRVPNCFLFGWYSLGSASSPSPCLHEVVRHHSVVYELTCTRIRKEEPSY